jgi:hypothetical protein
VASGDFHQPLSRLCVFVSVKYDVTGRRLESHKDKQATCSFLETLSIASVNTLITMTTLWRVYKEEIYLNNWRAPQDGSLLKQKKEKFQKINFEAPQFGNSFILVDVCCCV